MTELKFDTLIARLKDHATPRVGIAIEAARGRRGFDGFAFGTMHWSGPIDLRLLAPGKSVPDRSKAGPARVDQFAETRTKFGTVQ